MDKLTYESENDVECSPCAENDVPKPEEDVDLLIDDVLSQEAECVDVFNNTRGAVLMECTLCYLKQKIDNFLINYYLVYFFSTKRQCDI